MCGAVPLFHLWALRGLFQGELYFIDINISADTQHLHHSYALRDDDMTCACVRSIQVCCFKGRSERGTPCSLIVWTRIIWGFLPRCNQRHKCYAPRKRWRVAQVEKPACSDASGKGKGGLMSGFANYRYLKAMETD
jgi:hypothetical protein